MSASRASSLVAPSSCAVTRLLRGEVDVHEHEVLTMILNEAIASGRLQAGNRATLEFVARRLKLIKEAVSENPPAPSWESARLYMGTEDRQRGGVRGPILARLRRGLDGIGVGDSPVAPEGPRGGRRHGPRKGMCGRGGDGRAAGVT